jgi:hypothetical protein
MSRLWTKMFSVSTGSQAFSGHVGGQSPVVPARASAGEDRQ